jgi:outer membrane protein assembly factor BamB
MKFKNKKALATIISMILIVSMATTLLGVTSVQGQTGTVSKRTYAMVGSMPNPVGVGQEVLIWVGITDMLRVYSDGWEGLTVTVTKPDNTTETLGPFRTDSTGSTGTVYVPTMVGTYYLQTHFPAQSYNWTVRAMFDPQLYGLINYEASSSEIKPLTVQENPITHYPSSALPTEFWTRPIDAQHRDWYTISANWVTAPANLFAPNNDDAPESAHVLWRKTLQMGGLAGGSLGEQAFECGDAYEGFYTGSVIIGGNLYYNRFKADGATRIEQEVVAVNLHTGEELWVRNWNNTRLAFGQVFYWDSFNYHGVFPYLWSTAGNTWNAYDALTGRWVFGLTNVPTASVQFGASYTVRGEKDEIFIYNINLAQGWMALWNSSRAIQPQATGGSGDGSWIRGQMGTMIDARRGYEWNVTIPKGLAGGVNRILDDRIIGSTASGWTGRGDQPISMWAISLNPGQEGQLLFNKNWTLPHADLTINWGSASLEDGIFVIRAKETRQWWGFDLNTGNQIWGPTTSEEDLGIYGMTGSIAYGKLFAANKYGGTVYAYDIKTGELEWSYTTADPYNEILWSNNWPMATMFITDGKIYLAHSEHSPVDPKPRGAPFLCLDAETGEVVWKIDGAFRTTDWGGKSIIGDSIIATYNSYDQQIYAIGKGPSAITLATPDAGVQFGASIMIKGTVTDVSPGTQDYALKARFPNGVPAIADENMSEWMKYVYMQFAKPTDLQGVEVTLSVVDSNSNMYEIGKTTSDATGAFGFKWVPEIAGQYKVIATFAGSKSYWPATTQAYLAVDEAAQPTPLTQTQTPAQPTEIYFAASTAAIIAAIAIAVLVLKKK